MAPANIQTSSGTIHHGRPSIWPGYAIIACTGRGLAPGRYIRTQEHATCKACLKRAEGAG